MKKAIIGGTGVYSLKEELRTQCVTTPFGEVTVFVASIGDEEIVFLPRHGKTHSVPPHLVNYRANIKALEMLGVKYVYATGAVGSMNQDYAPGDIVMINDFLDFTKNRPLTFFDGETHRVGHVDMTEPYCPNLREKFYEAAREEGLRIKGEGVYVCTEGPRFETAREISMYQSLGGDVVGMTNIPEAVLAKEFGMCYQVIAMVTNWCTGVKESPIAMHDIETALGDNKEKISRVFLKVFQKTLDQDHCHCSDSVVFL
ncbi:MAG: 5'-methylthioadenosine phosphorylase [delta proteobacterium ML8_F1]|nr:MAG: 5'-methylthioadenosine phosphorylase [delta proteobacterium ML8_F1]